MKADIGTPIGSFVDGMLQGLDWPRLIFITAIFVCSASLGALAWQAGPGRRRSNPPDGQGTGDERAGVDPQGVAEPDDLRDRFVISVVRLVGPLARYSMPKGPVDANAWRLRFAHAGWHHPLAPTAFLALKTLLSFALPVLALIALLMLPQPLSAGRIVFLMGLAALIGMLLPGMVLERTVRERQRAIVDACPDALDLLTVCLEAGLSLEAALGRVAQETAGSRPILAGELHRVTLEMRAGRGREVALRNLARRTGVKDIESLVATLVQAEQFGVGMAESLRIHSDMLRTRRRQRAEEHAAKMGTKLSFPLVACILPTLLLALAGPAVMKLGSVMSVVLGAP